MNQNWEQLDADFVWHPYTQMQLVPRAIGVSQASGSYLYLKDGKKILDAISSWWLTLHGHCHPKIASAIASQAATLEQVIFAGFTHQSAGELACKLIEATPANLRKVFFSDNGSTAVEVAIKMCIQFWEHHGESRRTFLALEHAYHGDTFGAMSVSAASVFTEPFKDFLFEVRRLPFPYPPDDPTVQYSDSEINFLTSLEYECKTSGVAGLIYEPLLLGAGGMFTWRAQVLEAALQILKSFGVLAIADEVLTGFGRTGQMFASDHVPISPDIMTLSKGITGGFLPMGATLTSQPIFDAFLSMDRSKTFFHGHSYTGNPISCAAALASLSIFENEPVAARIESIASAHRTFGVPLARKHGLKYRQIGTIAAFEPATSKGYLSNKSLSFGAATLDMGLLMRPLGDILYLLPPYSTTVDDLRFAYDTIDHILSSN